MTILLIVLGALVLSTLRPVHNGYNEQYLEKVTTQSINGIFILLVFLSHFCTYIETNGPMHQTYMSIRRGLGQMVVTTFLFYSGYGVAFSMRKNTKYTRSLLTKRIPLVWSQFAIAVLLYALVQFGMKQYQKLTIKNILLSLLAWNVLGNSNWYIFTIIFLYFFSYIVFMLSPPHNTAGQYRGIIALCLLCTIYCAILTPYRPQYCYNTVFCYVAGVLFAFEKENIDCFLRQKNRYWVAVIVIFLVFRIAHIYWKKHLVAYQITACAFAVLVVLLTMKIQIKSKFLQYCGKHLFSLYILQRIPMLILQKWLQDNLYTYIGLSLAITFILSWSFDYILSRARRKFFGSKVPIIEGKQ